ncbi:MAG: response regulator transcription factor [Myxococcales bacterium]|nr:response regulator transcription factor [Myxococcales bacterium]
MASTSLGSRKRAKRILIVEDDPVSWRALADYLAAQGYTTMVAETGPEGLRRFHDDRPDLMLIDVQLPLKNGFELTFEVRQTPRGRDVPILLMSAVYTDVDHAGPYAERGLQAQGYLVKPFRLRQMLDKVRALLPD